MHPKAALLCLAGFVPYKPIADVRASLVRFMRPDFQPGDEGLRCRGSRWDISATSVTFEYVEVEWSAVSDDDWGELTHELLNEALTC